MVAVLAIRRPGADDVPAMAAQAAQLGYAVTPDELRARLHDLGRGNDAVVLVATGEGERTIGWIHVELKRTLLAPLSAQVMALVVDERQRGGGVGAELLKAGEGWALEHRCHRMLVATRITRERAHGFYRREGYTLDKTSHIFEKEI
ncbi:MAG TPA: GNAT family N-acetyltransferase [Candidatus Limnocylindria bacterium]|nr:GNAT family N-acetyltransferase [Candidatus Limnocylindria bacterium]